jgi:NADH-ubiquinone oxidoreductase chain 6
MMGKQVYTFLQDTVNTDNLQYVTSKNWDGNLVDNTDIISIGNIMYTSYSIWLLITSIILLLAMVGAIVITIKQKN